MYIRPPLAAQGSLVQTRPMPFRVPFQMQALIIMMTMTMMMWTLPSQGVLRMSLKNNIKEKGKQKKKNRQRKRNPISSFKREK
jgi:thiol:disulfide interchange protein